MAYLTGDLEGDIIQGEEYLLHNVRDMFREQFIKCTRNTCFVGCHGDFRMSVCFCFDLTADSGPLLASVVGSFLLIQRGKYRVTGKDATQEMEGN